MGVITGSIDTKTSNEDVAYSEDDDVVAGPQRAGCGWCPPDQFERVGARADIITDRTMNDREDARHRDLLAQLGEANANLYVAKTVVVGVALGQKSGKRKVLKTNAILAYIQAMALTNPAALDLLAKRAVRRTRLRDPADLYPENRRALGYPEPEPEQKPEDKTEGEPPEEVTRADGEPKSESAAGA